VLVQVYNFKFDLLDLLDYARAVSYPQMRHPFHSNLE